MYAIESLEAGIDWLAQTFPNDDERSVQCRESWSSQFQYIVSQGFRVQPRRLYGYEGHQAGGNFLGASDLRMFSQFTSAAADEAFLSVYEPYGHVSRIDLQVTVKYEQYQRGIADWAYDVATAVNEALPEGRRRKIVKWGGNDGGATTYIGSAKSDMRGKIYNKEVESGETEYERCWRYEIVLRNDHAVECARALWDRRNNLRPYICDAVAHWFRSRGVICGWTVRDAANTLPRVRPDRSDIEKSLQWLDTQVRPTVRRLIDAGYQDVVEYLLFGTGSEPDQARAIKGIR